VELVVISGPPAVGKLTVGKELARLTGFRLFHNHLTVDLVASDFRSGTEPNASLREAIWLTVFDHACRYDVPGLVFTIAFATWSPSAGFLPAVERVVGGRGRVRYVELSCARDVLLRRVLDPSRGAYDKVRGMLRIDTTLLGPAETARQVAGHYRLPILTA
jgi:MoxR-like ATPase